jgi:hypothetical protein
MAETDGDTAIGFFLIAEYVDHKAREDARGR